MDKEKKRRIDAFPTKSFFIKTLTKDVQLIDSVLDLIDNSIDSYIEKKIKNRRKIDITINKDKFCIKDNCGGIDKEKIYDKVFKFGLPTESRGKTIGVYGIGMKRAIFKMGRDITIESDDGKNNYSINIGDEWLEDEEDWELDFNSEQDSTGEKFTRITITKLYPSVSEEFENTKFINQLNDRIRDTYSIFIDEMVDIKLNDNCISSYDFNFLKDDTNFAPFHKKYKIDDVNVEIFAGFTPIDKTEEDKTYGWWVFCNNRMILKNNTKEKTGWGGVYDKERNYHYPEDNRFLGLVFFNSDNAMSLPWHTTKEDIQEDSRIYKQIQMEMKSVTKRLTDVIRLAGRKKDPETGETIGASLFRDIPVVSRKEITEESNEIIPVVKGEFKKEIVIVPDYTYITYERKKKIVKKVKKHLGDPYMTNKEMGEKTFNYYVEMEEIEND